MAKKRLYRSQIDKMIGGVCGGLGEYFDVDPVMIRLIFIILAFASGIGIIAYIFLWIALPKGPFEVSSHKMEDKVQSVVEEAAEVVEGMSDKIKNRIEEKSKGSFWLSVFLIVLGIFFLLSNYGFLNFHLIWPLIIIAIGVFLLYKSLRE